MATTSPTNYTAVIAVCLTTISLAGAGLFQWKSNTDRILTLEVQLAAQRINQQERDNRQDSEVARVASEVTVKLDRLSTQLKFITDKLIESGFSNG